MIRSGIFTLLLISTCYLSAYSQNFRFNSECQAAYKEIIRLRIEPAEEILEREKQAQPDNFVLLLLEDYVDFLRVFISENKDEYDRLSKNKDDRINVIKKQGNKESPYYYYTLGEIHFHSAVLKIRFGDYVSAIFEMRRAFRLMEQNKYHHPEFKPTYKTMGLLHAVLGSVPDKYKWGVSLLGMEGDIKLGMQELETLVDLSRENKFLFKEETVTLYAFLLFHLGKDGDGSWQILEEFSFPDKTNLMDYYTIAHIGIHTGRTNKAIEYLHSKPEGSDYLNYPHLDYLMGLAKLYRQDDDADVYFGRYLESYKGKNHIKDSYQKLAWFNLLRGDTSSYINFMENAKRYGDDVIDADKQAKREAQSGVIPNVSLLKARLLFDGGYYEKASKFLETVSIESLEHIEHKTEYTYRLGRIYHEWGKIEQSIPYYLRTIDRGNDIKMYYAANAALQLGYIYEGKEDIREAVKYYELCLDMKNHEYKNSIDQKAKAALNRLSKK